MAITTLDGLIAGMKLASAFTAIASATTEGGGYWHSFWKNMTFPGSGANPPAYTAGSGYSCTRTTAGALIFSNPVSGNSYLARLSVQNNSPGRIILYDRLWTCSGLVTNTGTTQTVTTPGTIPSRDINGTGNGDGVELWGEVYTAPGATGATWTVNYKDQGNNNGAATYTHPANAETVGQMFPFILASGDTGVRSVVDFTCSISSGTAGDIGLTLLRRIADIPILANNTPADEDFLTLNLARIYDDSCLALMMFCNTTSSGQISGDFTVAQG